MLPFSLPHIDQKIIDAVSDVLRSGWITTGPRTKELEKNLTAYCGNPATMCVNSATNGLELMLRWFGVGEGDEVIVPAYTYCATANVVVHCGAKPVMVDVNKNDFNISVENLSRAFTKNTKAIVPVDFAGFPCDYDAINTLVKNESSRFLPLTGEQEMLGRILVLSDAAHSIGARYKTRITGNQTDLSVFSFHAVKNLTTAEGGAIALNLPLPFDNIQLYEHLRVKSLHGQTKDALAKTRRGEWRYDVVEAGYKCNMTDIQAAIGLVELDRYESDILKKRKSVFGIYSEELSKFSWAELPIYETPDKTSSFHLYPLRIRNITEAQRDSIIKEIFDRDISVNVHFIPLPMLGFYMRAGYDIHDYPNAYNNYSREISLPVYYDLTEDQINAVIKAVVKSVETVIG